MPAASLEVTLDKSLHPKHRYKMKKYFAGNVWECPFIVMNILHKT